jgi:hypothetical protein
VTLENADFRAIPVVGIGRAPNQMRITAAFATTNRPNGRLLLDDEGTFLHSPAPNPDGCLLCAPKKARNSDHSGGNNEKTVQNRS